MSSYLENFLDVIPKLDIGNFLDVTSKLTILGAVIAVVFSVILKRRRLRKAIISDIKIAFNHHNYYFTEEEFNNLNSLIDKTDNYQPVMITSGKPVTLSNMTDDIAYLPPKTVENILQLVDLMGFIDNTLAFCRTHEFATLPKERKKKILSIPFNKKVKFVELCNEIQDSLKKAWL